MRFYYALNIVVGILNIVIFEISKYVLFLGWVMFICDMGYKGKMEVVKGFYIIYIL